MGWREFFFTGAGTGYFPFASGTAATILALAIYAAEYLIFGTYVWLENLIVVACMIYPSVRLCGDGEKYFRMKDPTQVVLDEIIGFKISVLLLPFNWYTAIIAFCLFRIFDIIKPWPAGKLEHIDGGLGIMVDDMIAGLYSLAVLLVILSAASFLDIRI